MQAWLRAKWFFTDQTCIICISNAVRHLDTETRNFFASNAGLPNWGGVMMTGTFIIRINGPQAALNLKLSVFYESVVSDRNFSRFTSSLYIMVRSRLTFVWSQCWPKLMYKSWERWVKLFQVQLNRFVFVCVSWILFWLWGTNASPRGVCLSFSFPPPHDGECYR